MIRKLAKELGRSPSQADMRKAGVPWHRIYNLFGGMRPAVVQAGLEPGPRGEALNEGAMILDWAAVVRKLRRLPSRGEYDRMGKHYSGTLHARLEWSQMAHRFVLMATEFHLQSEWEDVLAIVIKRFPLLAKSSERPALSNQPKIETLPPMNVDNSDKNQPIESAATEDDTPAWLRARGLRKIASGAFAIQMLIAMAGGQAINFRQSIHSSTIVYSSIGGQSEQGALSGERSDPPEQTPEHGTEIHLSSGERLKRVESAVVYGAPLSLAAMAHAPTNEAGVLFLFGILAERLRFRIERVQTGFPDCYAKREVRPGVWKNSKVELEFESRNFKEHRHDPKGCDVIVCWVHNWPECPPTIEVIELSRVIAEIARAHA